MVQDVTTALKVERQAVARQRAAMASLKALPKGATVEANRLACLECHLADIDVALIRIPRGPRTARRVGELRKQRSAIDAIIRDLQALMLAKKR